MNQLRADKWLLYSLSACFFMTGASLWETVIFTPAWTLGVPSSLAILQPPNGLNPVYFWVIVHSLFEIIFIAALVFNWKIKETRKPLLAIFALYAVIRIWTLCYFAPTFIEFQKIPYNQIVDISLTQRTQLWKNLNYLRTGILIYLNLWMLFVLKKRISSNEKMT
jgi:hypothetical protein